MQWISPLVTNGGDPNLLKSLYMYTGLSVLYSSYIIALWVVALVSISYGMAPKNYK